MVLILEPKREDAAIKLRELRARFDAVFRARRQLFDLVGGPASDTHSTLRHPEPVEAAPREPLAALLAYSTSPGEPWYPTTGEMDAAAAEAREANPRRNRLDSLGVYAG